MRRAISLLISILLLISALSACSPKQPLQTDGLQVVVTTSILADVVARVGGEHIAVTTLVPVGVNEHEYQPAPRDVAAVTDAQVIFEVGFGLEEFMEKLINSSGTSALLVTTSEGVPLREFSSAEKVFVEAEHISGDPHVWLDPANVVIWTQNISTALSTLDPDHQSDYQSNADAYIAQLVELDGWIAQQVETIPTTDRKIVTDHMLLGYFAAKYGFEVIGAVIPSYSSSAQPSAQELAALEDAIRQYKVRAILVGNTVNPSLAERIASDTGIDLVSFYTGSLSPADGPAATYLDYMHYNVNAIVSALGD